MVYIQYILSTNSSDIDSTDSFKVCGKLCFFFFYFIISIIIF